MVAVVVRHFPRMAVFLIGVGLLVAASPGATAAAEPYRQDTYRAGAYERQVDGRTCTAASTAMMLNFIAGRDLGLSQLGILAYARPRDALADSRQRGSDPLGWSRALTHFADRTGSEFSYDWEAFSSEAAALKRAAIQIARTGRPVGLVIWNGRHAVVMTGFEATSDPRDGKFRLISVWISDPYGARHTKYAARSAPLNRYLERDATRKFTKAWYGNFVIIVPQG